MRNIQRQFLLLLGIVIVLVVVNVSCSSDLAQGKDNYSQVRLIAKPYAFDFVLWEAQAISSLIGEKIFNSAGSDQETRLHSQIEAVLVENRITIFPPLNFDLEKPPHLLVISPRDRIFYLDRVMLRQELNEEEMENLEAQVDKLGLSSLVVELGGFGATYPPIVDGNASLNFVINTAVEEWLHQYLAFRPLGFIYLLDSLGIKQDQDVIVMNETLAGMVSEEIGSQVYARYYAAEKTVKADKMAFTFDFDTEMRLTRRNVDLYLAQGDIEGAVRYMEERRQVFWSHGYKIRKLNQAYFAFHGIYGSDPASVSPIDGDLKLLRAESHSLKDFLDKTSRMSSYADLVKALQK
jgi:hypothetical protein